MKEGYFIKEKFNIYFNSKNKILIFSILVIFIFLFTILSITYAWFNTSADTEGFVVVKSGTLNITYTQGTKIEANNLKPATNAQVIDAYNAGNCKYNNEEHNEQICYVNTFIITNTGTLATMVTSSLTNVKNTYSNNLKYQIFTDVPATLQANSLNNATSLIGLANNTIIPALYDNVKTYTILIWLDENAPNTDQGKEYSATIITSGIQTNAEFAEVDGYLYDSNEKLMSNTNMQLNSIPIYTTTDEEGYFNFGYVETGKHTIIARNNDNQELMNDQIEIHLGTKNEVIEKQINTIKKVKVNIFGNNNNKIKKITLSLPNLSEAILAKNIGYADNTTSINVTAQTGIDFTNTSGNPFYKLGQTVAEAGDSSIGEKLYTITSYNVNELTGVITASITQRWRQTSNPCSYNYCDKNANKTTCTTIASPYGCWSINYIRGWNIKRSEKDLSRINGEGLYYTTDNTKTNDINGDGIGERVYYFRGNVNDNHAIFNDMCWRVIRINEDGSIKIKYNGTPTDGVCPTDAIGINSNGDYVYNEVNTDNRYVGYMYDDTCDTYDNCRQNKNNSYVKSIIDEWYKDNIFDKGTIITNKIADTIYCNDRSITSGKGILNSSTTYQANSRIFSTKSPTLKCTSDNDKFTVSNNIGNGALKYPIALLTADEIVYAGSGCNSVVNNSYYLYSNLNEWTITPSVGGSTTKNMYLSTNGYNNAQTSNTEAKIIPVISLTEKALVTSGEGLFDNPYIIN